MGHPTVAIPVTINCNRLCDKSKNSNLKMENNADSDIRAYRYIVPPVN